MYAVLGAAYRDYVRSKHVNTGGKAVDLITYFLRSAFDLIRPGSTFGLLTTNTVAQGDSRAAGLAQIINSGGSIYAAETRIKWPGQASVVVSAIHICRVPFPLLDTRLNGKSVTAINSSLFPSALEVNPEKLGANKGKSFQGSIVLGMGFTFDDRDANGISNTIEEMNDLITKDQRNQERIFPYIGGDEINSHPTHQHHRYVINFEDMTIAEASRWPELVDVLARKVKPERDKLGGYPIANRRRDFWWQFGTYTPSLFRALKPLDRFLAHAFTSKYVAFCFLSKGTIVAGPHNAFPMDTFAAFASLQSRLHEMWSRLLASSMGETLRYAPSDCFETFPFSENFETNPALEAAGQAYYDFRAALMIEHDEGLTKTYNRFHDPEETNAKILELRKLHAAMDRAVLDAYGWTDIPTDCAFILDYEEEEDATAGSKRKKKKPWRYRWPDAVRDEVLARLLELNAERAAEEARAQASAKPASGGKSKGRKKKVAATKPSLPYTLTPDAKTQQGKLHDDR